MDLGLDGRIALIVGGGRGIGRSIALALAPDWVQSRRGAALLWVALNRRPHAGQAARAAGGGGGPPPGAAARDTDGSGGAVGRAGIGRSGEVIWAQNQIQRR